VFGFNIGKTKSSSSQNVWAPQAGALTDIYGQAGNVYQQTQGQLPQAQSQLQSLQGPAMQAYGALAAGAQNPYLAGMAQAGFDQVGRQFQQQIMPGLVGGANAAGQLGGERFAQMQAQAAAEAQRAMGDVGNQIYGNAWQSGMQGQQAALQALPNLQNLGMASMALPWMNLGAYKSAVGAPTVLGASSSKGSSFGFAPGV